MSTLLDHERFFEGEYTLEKQETMYAPKLKITDPLRVFMGRVWPLANMYASPIELLFLFQIRRLNQLNKADRWIVRDGAVGLLWFFRQFPKPEGLKARLLVDEELIGFVPKIWRSHIGSYRVVSNVPKDPSRQAALIGYASESSGSIPFIRDRLEEIQEREGGQPFPAHLFAPARIITRFAMEQVYHAQYFHEVYKTVSNPRILKFQEIIHADLSFKLRAYDLNEKILIADSGVVHQVLLQGAELPLARPLESGEEFVSLSPHHGFAVRKQCVDVPELQPDFSYEAWADYQKRLGANYEQHAFICFRWTNWFHEWATTFAQKRRGFVESGQRYDV